MTDSTPIPSRDTLAQHSTGLLHSETTPVHCTSIKMAVLKILFLMLLMQQDLQCLVVKPVNDLAGKIYLQLRNLQHTPHKSQQRTGRDPSCCLDTQTWPPLSLNKISFFTKFGHCFEDLGTFNMKPCDNTHDPNAELVIHTPHTLSVHL